MNKIYKVIRNHLGQFVAVSENSRARGKKQSVIAGLVSVIILSVILPNNSFAAQISTPQCTSGNGVKGNIFGVGGIYVCVNNTSDKNGLSTSYTISLRKDVADTINNIATYTDKVTALENADKLNVKYNAAKDTVALIGTGGTKITNLKDGTISATSMEAVNGRQLNAVRTTANTANSTANTNKTNITALQAADALNVKYNADKSAVALAGTGGSKITNLKDGTVSATSTEAVNGKQLFGVQTTANTAKTTADGARTTATAAQTTATAAQNTANTANSTANTNKTNITALQAADALNVKYNADKSAVALAGTGGSKITNLKDGTVSATSMEAVNGRQLNAVRTTATAAQNTANTANSTANTNKTNITNLQNADKLNVKYNTAKDTVALAGTGGTKITNLKDGTVSATSTEAVNGKQLFGVQTTANTAKTTADGARTTATAAQTTATAAQ
ncbi:hypothetical protein FHQ27_11915, partial [Testudinibacter sp. TR-2022]